MNPLAEEDEASDWRGRIIWMNDIQGAQKLWLVQIQIALYSFEI